MVTPRRRHVAVSELQGRFGVSERRACSVLGQHRSTQRHNPRRRFDEEHLRRRLQAMSTKFPRYGYRRIHALLLREGYACNRKRIQRLWRDEGLLRTKETAQAPKAPAQPASGRGPPSRSRLGHRLPAR